MTEKYKIWDSQNNQWFRPVYPGFKTDKHGKQVQYLETREILFSQSGDMFLRESKDNVTFTHTFIDEKLFVPCLYSGIKDIEERKLYTGDIIANDAAKWKVIFNKGCFCAKRIDGSDGTQDTHLALRAIHGAKYIGNIHENDPAKET